MTNVSNKLNATLNCKLDPSGVENLQKKLKSYNLGKEFKFAIAVLKLSIANGENIMRSVGDINLIPKVQYITPFVSEELARKYEDELLCLDKLIMFLPIGEDGRVVLKNININNVMNEIYS